MKMPEGMTFHGHGYRLGAGKEVPDELLAILKKSPDFSAEHPLHPSYKPPVPASPPPVVPEE